MKIYTKVVIDIKTLEEVETECFDYPNEPLYCKGSGGGGSSGKVSYPAYLELVHQGVLDNKTSDEPITSVVEELNVVVGSNPYMGVTAYNPSTRIADFWTVVDAYETIVNQISETTGWAGCFTQAVATIDTNYTDPTVGAATDIASAWIDPSSDAFTDIEGDWDESLVGSMADIEADVDAYEDIADDHVTTDVLPRFQRGMQDINAVTTSGFTIGQAIIEGMTDRDISKYHGTLRVALNTQRNQVKAESILEKNKQKANAYRRDDELSAESKKAESQALAEAHKQDDRINAFSVSQENDMYMKSIDQMVRYVQLKLDANSSLAHTIIEANRISIVAEKEEDERQVSIDSRDALWNLEAFQYVGNLIAGISGGTLVPNMSEGPSRMQSTMGGAMSGAAMGTMVSPGMGTAVGAGVGAVMGYFAG